MEANNTTPLAGILAKQRKTGLKREHTADAANPPSRLKRRCSNQQRQCTPCDEEVCGEEDHGPTLSPNGFTGAAESETLPHSSLSSPPSPSTRQRQSHGEQGEQHQQQHQQQLVSPPHHPGSGFRSPDNTPPKQTSLVAQESRPTHPLVPQQGQQASHSSQGPDYSHDVRGTRSVDGGRSIGAAGSESVGNTDHESSSSGSSASPRGNNNSPPQLSSHKDARHGSPYAPNPVDGGTVGGLSHGVSPFAADAACAGSPDEEATPDVEVPWIPPRFGASQQTRRFLPPGIRTAYGASRSACQAASSGYTDSYLGGYPTEAGEEDSGAKFARRPWRQASSPGDPASFEASSDSKRKFSETVLDNSGESQSTSEDDSDPNQDASEDEDENFDQDASAEPREEDASSLGGIQDATERLDLSYRDEACPASGSAAPEALGRDSYEDEIDIRQSVDISDYEGDVEFLEIPLRDAPKDANDEEISPPDDDDESEEASDDKSVDSEEDHARKSGAGQSPFRWPSPAETTSQGRNNTGLQGESKEDVYFDYRVNAWLSHLRGSPAQETTRQHPITGYDDESPRAEPRDQSKEDIYSDGRLRVLDPFLPPIPRVLPSIETQHEGPRDDPDDGPSKDQSEEDESEEEEIVEDEGIESDDPADFESEDGSDSDDPYKGMFEGELDRVETLSNSVDPEEIERTELRREMWYNAEDSTTSPAKVDTTALKKESSACVRCRRQKLKCEENRKDPEGECLACMLYSRETGKTLHMTLCLRLKISGLVLFRQGGLNLTQRWQGIEMRDIAERFDTTATTILVSQDLCEKPLIMRVVRFQPRDGDVTARFWTACPSGREVFKKKELAIYCLEDICATAWEVTRYTIDNAVPAFMARVKQLENDSEEAVIRETYLMAVRHYHALMHMNTEDRTLEEAKEAKILGNLFVLWCAIQHTTGSFYIAGEETLGMRPETEDPSYPLLGKVSVPRMVVAQFDSLNYVWVLERYKERLMADMEWLLSQNNPRWWFIIYLVLFILLREASYMTADRYRHARANHGSKVRYSIPNFVESLHESCNNLLMHWHYYNCRPWPKSPDPDLQHRTHLRLLEPKQYALVMKTREDPGIQRQLSVWERAKGDNGKGAQPQRGEPPVVVGAAPGEADDRCLVEKMIIRRDGDADETATPVHYAGRQDTYDWDNPLYWVAQMFEDDWSAHPTYQRETIPRPATTTSQSIAVG